ncbi:hypothetical protein [Dysgonomonas sp. ZJ709]|uniref:hypothetical protein n=1 Tax=Dysgonomonas sp. ZJ709 TaxID=2709797 RepID=UPI0013ECF1CB|nr:hypothetical protein [Dysgonomonas sp. ZJ709]
MTGSVTIDGVDISTFGMFILKGGDYDFLPFPDRKEPEQNNWHDYNGVDVDLSEIYFKEKRVIVRFYIANDTTQDFLSNLNAFYTLISKPGYRQLYSRDFDKTFSLRYVSCPDYSHKGGLYKYGRKRGELTVEFSMDAPIQLFTRPTLLQPVGGRASITHVQINGYDLAAFGIIVNEAYNTVLNLPAVKPPLIRSFERRSGLLVHTPADIAYETKQIVINCTMTANTRAEFYTNYEALFNNLTLTTAAVSLRTYEGTEDCYYTAMQGFKKLRPFGSRIIVEFSLVLTAIAPGMRVYVLGTTDNRILLTIAGQAIKI